MSSELASVEPDGHRLRKPDGGIRGRYDRAAGVRALATRHSTF
jgi:hypothetical protein